MMFSACSTSSPPVVQLPNLPPPPALFGVPVPIPVPVKGQDARAFSAIERASILNANQRLRNDKAFQEDVWLFFSKPARSHK